MAYWLLKSEPFKYSYEKLRKDGSTKWDGVRNYTARNHLQAMKPGDQALFYHSNEGLAVVGTAIILKGAEPDTTASKDKLNKDGSNPWVVVTVGPGTAFKAPVSLHTVKNHPKLQNMALLKYSRLSVQPVTPEEWKILTTLGGL